MHLPHRAFILNKDETRVCVILPLKTAKSLLRQHFGDGASRAKDPYLTKINILPKEISAPYAMRRRGYLRTGMAWEGADFWFKMRQYKKTAFKCYRNITALS